ncbi:alpha/beta fold hydrolase [Paraglaciecola hydrolytica]|uniref:Alpha/beta hydrolase n=1 Tax=Paraglaciecola hydrolytica TaxID=1799789 RepID=A0A136A2H0_9ALTE|nr:alpha/beta hydrolase [Paraglaciecola hydrolytica]KXI29421.1 alpha/beta hydrolase [Paraglaciecola hydrolytica]
MSSLSFERYQQEAKTSLLCGHKIAYWQSYDATANNKQQTILFIHGFPSASWDWHYQWKYLARDYSLLCADMLGFGLSAKPRQHRYSLSEQADIFEALLQEKGVGDYHIMAHDYGDSVAQELLYRQATRRLENTELPQARLKSVCFLNGGIFPACHRPLLAQRLLKSWLGKWVVKYLSKSSLEKSFIKIFGKDTPPMQQEIDMIWQLLRHNDGHLVIPDILRYIDERYQWGERWVEAMITSTVPLYFINGIQDPISGRHMLDRYIEVIPEAQTALLDVGHYPQLEAPDEVLRCYRDFLQGIQS